MNNTSKLDAAIAEREARLAQIERESAITIDYAVNGFKPIVRRADKIIERELEPLWPGVLWRGYPTILAGEAGLSKSTVSIDVAARITRGDYWPGATVRAKRGNVLFLTAEDRAEDVAKPRLRVAGADMERVYFFDGLRSDEGKETDINLVEHLSALDKTIGTVKADLVIVDPISAYEGRTDSHKNSEVRAMLKGVQKVASRRRCAFLLISHYNKSTAQSGLQRIAGSIAYGAAVRAAFTVLRDESDAQSRLMLPAKLNFAPDGSGFRYSVTDCDGFPRITWSDETVTDRLDDLLHAPSSTPKYERCAAFLKRVLADAPNNELEVEDLQERARTAGYGRDAFYKAVQSARLQKTGGNQHTKASYRLIESSAIELPDDEDWLR